jgi:hypothetical protein
MNEWIANESRHFQQRFKITMLCVRARVYPFEFLNQWTVFYEM